jgi:hypothetical protein
MKQIINPISSSASSDNNLDSNVVPPLILSHLIHQGYQETALCFFESISSCSKRENTTSLSDHPGAKTIGLRQKLRKLLVQGHVDQVFELLASEYPTLLSTHHRLHLCLCIQKFIELIRFQASQQQENQMEWEGSKTKPDVLKNDNSFMDIIEYGRDIQAKFFDLIRDDTHASEALTVILLILMISKFFHLCATKIQPIH